MSKATGLADAPWRSAMSGVAAFQDLVEEIGLHHPAIRGRDRSDGHGQHASGIAEGRRCRQIAARRSPRRQYRFIELCSGAGAVGYRRHSGELVATGGIEQEGPRSPGEALVLKAADRTLPFLDVAGAPAGIDIRKMLETGLWPVIDTAIAHRPPGRGQVGVARAPQARFGQTLEAIAAIAGKQ